MKTKTLKNKKSKYNDLVQRYKLLTDLMDQTPDVIYFKDNKGKLIMVNQAHARGLGLKPEEVVGKTDFDFFPRGRAETMSKDDRHVIKSGKAIIDKVERATRPDGVDNYVSTTKIPRYDDKGNIIGLIGITRDITWRKQVEHLREEKTHIQKKLEALEELNNMKSEFVSVVSHELRTPLAIIKEAVLLVFDEIAGPVNEKQKELLTKARQNVDRLNNIIEELLDISRIERGKLKLHYSLVNLNDLLMDSSDFFKNLAREKNIEISYSLPKHEVNIFLDTGRVNQIITNLINNAIKYTEQNGKIRVELELLESRIRIGVIDTGIGIAKQDLSKLFDKFVQVSKGADADRKGVGLGLPIAKELVERHGGEIWMESRLGVGTKSYFTLPLFYTIRILEKNTREKINTFLNSGISVYLVNLLIVNFKEFKKKVKIHPETLFADIGNIIRSMLESFNRPDKNKPQIVLENCNEGEWSILLPEASEKDITGLSGMFKNRIKAYLADNDIKDVFINMGIMPYSKDIKSHGSKQLFADIHLWKISIGSETRRFKRTEYKADIELISPDNKTEETKTIDISRGGICILSGEKLKTNAKVKIKLKFSVKEKPFCAVARVAWLKTAEEKIKQANKYKIGLEFVEMDSRERKKLLGYLK
jgi:PAS domain S-box-containing protein